MGGTSSKIVRSNQSSPPDTPVLNDSLALTVDDNAKGIITNYAKGCWVGNHHKPLINNLSGTKPFFIIRITRKQISSKDLESLEKSNDGSMIVLWLESKYKSTSILTVCYQSSSEILTMFTMPAPDFETNEPDTTRRQFQCEPLQYGETANFMVYVGNSEYIEGEYALAVRSLNDQYVANLYVPRQYNRKWWNNEELQISTTLIGSWEGFSSYGGAPYSITDNAWLLNNPSCIISTKDTARCWITLTKSYFSEKEAYTSDLCWSDKHEGFGMGLVLLKLKYGETRIVDTKGIDERITGHSIFPINAEANLVDFRAFLVKGRYQIIIFPQEKRCVGKYCLLIKSDTELMSKPLKPNTCLTELGTVWLNNPLPVAIPNLKYQCPTFNLTTKSSTFAIVTLELPSSQYDYEDNFQVNGHLICLENSREIKMWMFHLGMYSNTQHHRGKNLLQLQLISSLQRLSRYI